MTSDPRPLTRRRVLAGAAATAALAATNLPRALAEDNAPRSPAVPPTARMPAAYIGHGSPLLALDATKGAEFTSWTKSMPTPVAVLVVSAHFERAPATLGATTTRPLIYDFSGFPRALYRLRYAAPGAPRLAHRVTRVLAPLGGVRADPARGLDHGAWVPLRWMYPRADVPVLSLSLPTHDPRSLFRFGRALRPLRDEGVLILGSGSLTHNLRRMDPRPQAPIASWAAEFDHWAQTVLERGDVDSLLDWQRKAPAARTNHPTVEHFVPLLLAAGARHDDDRAAFPIRGFEMGSLSRRSVSFVPPARTPSGG